MTSGDNEVLAELTLKKLKESDWLDKPMGKLTEILDVVVVIKHEMKMIKGMEISMQNAVTTSVTRALQQQMIDLQTQASQHREQLVMAVQNMFKQLESTLMNKIDVHVEKTDTTKKQDIWQDFGIVSAFPPATPPKCSPRRGAY